MNHIPKQLPPLEVPGVYGADPVQDARDSAEAIRNLAAGEYNDANANFSSAVAAYQAANNHWMQVADQLTQQETDACTAHRAACYAKLGLQSASVTLAFGKLGECDAKIAQGDMMPPAMAQQKIAKYNEGEGLAQESRNASAAANQRYTEFGVPLAAWQAVLQPYG